MPYTERAGWEQGRGSVESRERRFCLFAANVVGGPVWVSPQRAADRGQTERQRRERAGRRDSRERGGGGGRDGGSGARVKTSAW